MSWPRSNILYSTSIIKIYEKYIREENGQSLLRFLPVYKCSQDHLEIYFWSIRSQGGCNDNPTSKRFKNAYRKILVNAEIREDGLGNCVPLEQIPILRVSSRKAVEDIINLENVTYNETNNGVEDSVFTESFFEEHNYFLTPDNLSLFSQEIVIYIAGFIAFKLSKSIKCEHCVGVLFGDKANLVPSFIDFKNRGGLHYPSKDLIDICIKCEKLYKNHLLNQNNIKVAKQKILIEIAKFFITKKSIFNNHVHSYILIKAIANCFLNIRFKYM
jgi:hypothetical protein